MNIEGFHDLIVRAKGGDRAAFDEAISHFDDYLERLAAPYREPAVTAVDLAQEARLQAWKKIHTFKGGKDDETTHRIFKSWLKKILTHNALNAVRKRKRKCRHPEEKPKRLDDEPTPMSPDITPSRIYRRQEQAERIEEALNNLPDQVGASIVRMFIMEGVPLTEISKQLDLDYEKARARFNRAMRDLEDDLRDLL